MAREYRYSLEPCPVCNAWAVKALSQSGEEIWICNNLGAYWHGCCKEQQALQQSWKKAHSPRRIEPQQYREILVPQMF